MWCLLSLITTAKAPVASDIDGRLLPTETCTTHAAANNYSWLMEQGPVDWVMRSRGVVETWDFASDQCRALHHQCVARPPSLWTERCEQRLHACLRVIATRDDCLTVLDACVFVSNGSLRIHSPGARLANAPYMDAYTGLQRSSSSRKRTVHRLRNHEADKYRLRLPVVSRSSGGERCVGARTRWDDGHHRPSFLGNATLISPVWGTNFGETLLNSIYPLSNHPQPDALLLAGSSLMREEWPATRRFWRDLLDLFWASASLRLLAPPLDRHARPRSRGPSKPRLVAAPPTTGGSSVHSGVRATEEAAVLGGGADAPTLRVGRLELCHTRDIFDGGRKAMQGAQPSLLGLLTRRTLRSPPRNPRPLRIGIITPTALANRRRLQNVAELLRVCAPLGVLCEEVHLDVAGAAENVQRVLPLHGLVALHGSHMSYAAFPERPLAILEVKPWPMSAFWFQKYFPSFFALDSWYFVHHATPDEHRNGATSGAPQQQAAVLPPGVFSDFVCLVVRRFAEHDAKVQRAADGGTGAGGE